MPTQDRITHIRHFPLFTELDAKIQQALAEMSTLRTCRRYQFIYLADDPAEKIYLLLSGVVKVGVFGADGKEVIKSLIHPKAIFGEMCLLGERQRQNFARTLKEEVTLLELPRIGFQRLIECHLGLSRVFMAQFGQRLLRAEEQLESLIFKDARSRIVNFIHKAVEQRGQRVGVEMLLRHNLTHQDIASYTCTSRQTVTQVMNELKKEDLIYFNRGSILVRDMARLV